MNIEEAYAIARQYEVIKKKVKLEILNLEHVLGELKNDLCEDNNWVAVVNGKHAIQDTVTRIKEIEEGQYINSK